MVMELAVEPLPPTWREGTRVGAAQVDHEARNDFCGNESNKDTDRDTTAAGEAILELGPMGFVRVGREDRRNLLDLFAVDGPPAQKKKQKGA